MDGHFSDILCLLKNGQKSYSFADHFEQHFNTIMSRTYLRKYMTFKVVDVGDQRNDRPLFFLCLVCVTYINSVTHQAFYFVY